MPWSLISLAFGIGVPLVISAGAVFGELALLNIPGAKSGNRRSATVISRGYTHCYCLSREDLWAAFDKFPGAKEVKLHVYSG